MKMRGISFFLATVFIFSFLSQTAVRALWIQKNGHLMWASGEVLGGQDSEQRYTYIITSSIATDTSTQASSLTAQSGATASESSSSLSSLPHSSSSSVSSATTSSSSTSSSSHASGIKAEGLSLNSFDRGDNNKNSSSSSSSSSSVTGSSTSSSSSSSAPPNCGQHNCNQYEACYQDICWLKCDAGGNCLGLYYCYNGACLPTSGSASSYSQAPTATPYPVQNTASGPPKTPSGGDNSPPPTAIPTLIAPNRPTNTPYPTRVPQNTTYFNSGAGGGAPVIILPTPTPIPDSLQGKNSTIVIETGNTTTILKGEDVNAITIAAPVSAAEHKSSSSAPAGNNNETAGDSKPAPLDLALVQKTGTKYALRQEELVVQKGKQKVTISAGGNDSGALVLAQNDIRANVNMGLSINPNTNILTVDTPQGPMRVAIMPEDAVAIARQLKIADPSRIPSDVTLLSKDNQLEYKISATKMEKLFWVIPVTIPQDVYLLADTGGLVEIKRTNLYNFITLFTF